MRLTQLYSEHVKKLPQAMQEYIIREAPHTIITSEIPKELAFLNGTIDLGFENLDISLDEKRNINQNYLSGGLGIPGTKWRLVVGQSGFAEIEPADGDEHQLPVNWPAAVLVVGDDGKPTWIGHLVRPDQIGTIDRSQYHAAKYGLTK